VFRPLKTILRPTLKTLDSSSHVTAASRRVIWVEYAKAIGIILVVYGHAARGAQAAGIYPDEHRFVFVDSVIYSFHMPLFFFLSGLFFTSSIAKRGPLRFIANKFDSLFYPYALWSVLQGSIEVLLSHWTNSHASATDVAQFLWSPRAQLWFLYALLSVSILAALLLQARSTQRSVWIMLGAMVAFIFRDYSLGCLPVAYVMTYFVFFMMGVCFEGSQVADWIDRKRWSLVVPTVTMFVLAQGAYHFVLGLTYRTGNFLALVLAMISLVAMVTICMCLSDRQRPLLAVIGSASLVIYLLHILVASGTRILFASVLHYRSLPAILTVSTLFGVLIPLAVFRQTEKGSLRFLFAAPARISLENMLQSRVVRLARASSRDAAGNT
jgi:fucose 4-O-acetylase-like acetyltransferase